jgi:hypothetical protein
MKLQEGLQKYLHRLYNNFIELTKEVKKSRENPYQIAGWIKKENKEKDILIYHVTATDKYVSSFSVLEIYQDDSILYQFSKQEIKYISTLALLLYYKKEARYKVIWENFRHNLHEGIIHLKDREKPETMKTNIEQLEKNITLLDALSGHDAYLLGKEMGIKERMQEEEIICNG